MKAGKGRRLVLRTSIHRLGRKFDILVHLEAHAALAHPGDLEGDPLRWKAEERAVAQAVVEAAAQFCWPGYAPEVLDSAVTVAPIEEGVAVGGVPGEEVPGL